MKKFRLKNLAEKIVNFFVGKPAVAAGRDRDRVRYGPEIRIRGHIHFP